MSKRKRSPSPQRTNGEAGSAPSLKKQKRDRLTQLACAGALDDFNARYKQGRKLGSGGFGSVYKGERKSDGLEVAIKRVPKTKADFITLNRDGIEATFPREVFLLFIASSGPERLGQRAAVSYLEWFKSDIEVIIIMERPYPSMSLRVYRSLYEPLPEGTARDITRQLVLALIHLHKKRIFHRDIKPDNILIQETEDGIRVRIVDFGCGCLVSTNPYTIFSGTRRYCPPEVFQDKKYNAGPTSVWQIGALAYELLHFMEFFDTYEWVDGEQTMEDSEASEEAKQFVQACLEVQPSKRITLEELDKHPWISNVTPEN